MPKVTQKYTEEKRGHILDAAACVCRTKPLFAVTMQDIINETGSSQGAIYRYYQDTDDIFIAVMNRYSSVVHLKQDIICIFESSESPESILRLIFQCLETYLYTSHLDYCKMLFEVQMIYTAYPKRAAKYRHALLEQESYDILLAQSFQFISEQIAMGYFKPLLPLEHIIAFAVSGYDGIIKNVIMTKCYAMEENLPVHTLYDEAPLFDTLCQTILYLLGAASCI